MRFTKNLIFPGEQSGWPLPGQVHGEVLIEARRPAEAEAGEDGLTINETSPLDLKQERAVNQSALKALEETSYQSGINYIYIKLLINFFANIFGRY